MVNFRLVGIYNLVTGITRHLQEQKMKRYDLVIFLATVKNLSARSDQWYNVYVFYATNLEFMRIFFLH